MNSRPSGNSTNATVRYDWAVVSGGPPSFDSLAGNTCTTFMPMLPSSLQYRGGLWIFTRKPIDSAASAAAESAAQGINLSAQLCLGCDLKMSSIIYTIFYLLSIMEGQAAREKPAGCMYVVRVMKHW